MFHRADFVPACVWPLAEGRYYLQDEQIKPVSDDDWRPRAPLSDPDLFVSFARLGRRGHPSPKRSLRWVQKYGLLTRQDEQHGPLIVNSEVREQWINVVGSKNVTPPSSPLDSARRSAYEQARKKAYDDARTEVLAEITNAGLGLEDLSLEQRKILKERISRSAETYREWEELVSEPTTERLTLNQAPITLKDFRAEVHNVYSALTLYECLRNRDITKLRSRVQSIRDKEAHDSLSEVDQWLFDRVSDDSVESPKGAATLRWLASWGLETFVQERLANVRLSFFEIDPKPGYAAAYAPAQSWHCPDLLSAIYLQFYIWIIGAWPMRYCDNDACGLPFPATRTDKRYCTDACRSAARDQH